MRKGRPVGSRRRRGSRADEPYAHFYASYYGLDEPAGPPTRHRAAGTHTGAALLAGLGALMHRKVVVILTLGVAAICVLAFGVMASATRTGSDPKLGPPSLVDRTSAPAGQGVIAAGTSSHAAGSPGAATPTRANGGAPVNAAPPAVNAPTASQAAQPSVGGSHSSQHSSVPSTTQHTTAPSSTHTSTTAPPPPTSSSPTPTPSPSTTCLVQDLLHPGHCLVKRP